MESNEGMGHAKAMQLADRAHSAFALRIAIYIIIFFTLFQRDRTDGHSRNIQE